MNSEYRDTKHLILSTMEPSVETSFLQRARSLLIALGAMGVCFGLLMRHAQELAFFVD